jgi:hypothetical protein
MKRERRTDGVHRRTIEHLLGHRIEDHNALILVYRDNRFHRRPNDPHHAGLVQR